MDTKRQVSPVVVALAAVGLVGGCAAASSSGHPVGGPTATDTAGAAPPAAGASPAASCASTAAAPSGAAAPALQTIQFTDQSHGWAAGAGRILATSDGGRTWSRQYSGSAVLRQLDFTDAAHGWAVGQDTLLRTTDGGSTWTALAEPQAGGHCLGIASVHFLSPAVGYAVAARTGTASTGAASTGAAGAGGGSAGAGGTGAPAAGGQLLRTTDGGVTWNPVPGAPAGAQAVCFGTAQDGYVGAGGRIWRTTDGGTSWSTAFTEPPAAPGQGAAAAARTGDTPELECAGPSAAWVLFLGTGAAMMHAPYLAYATTDGTGWHGVLEEPMLEGALRPQLHLPAGPGSEPGPFSVISPGTAAFVGYTPPANGEGAAPLVVATNGGTSLKTAGDVAGINQPLAAAFRSASQGWVVGENLKTNAFEIEATTDAGRTWTTQYTTG